jgi:hypothetical protein
MPIPSKPRSGPWIVLIGLAVLVTAVTSPRTCRAQGGDTFRQVWVLVDVQDEESGRVKVQVPLEWIKHDRHLTTCHEHGERHGLDGRRIYREYRDLPEGEERTVDTYTCDDSDVTVRVKSERLEEGPPVERIRLLVHDHDGKNVDLAISLNAADFLGKLFSGAAFSFSDSDDRELRPFLDGDTRLLRRLPPFELVRVRDEGESVVIRTE